MTDTDIIELKNVDSEDIGDVLVKIEKSFDIKFGATELKDVKTFGELCDIITSKIELDIIEDCTTQQAFYKLRNAIVVIDRLDKNFIQPETDLENIFPKHARRQKISLLENELAFSLKILRPKHWVTTMFVLILLASIVAVFFFWQVGLTGLLLSIGGLKLSDKFGKELDLKTVGELVDKISREHYFKARRNTGTVNKKEVAEKITKLFINDLDLHPSVLTRDATFR